MFYVYFLKSEKDNQLYIGRTNNLQRRFSEHQYRLVSATKSRRPLILLGHYICKNEAESVQLEKEWKKGYKREELKRRFNLK